MADRTSPFDGIEELLNRLNRQLETATRSWESRTEGPESFEFPMGESGTSLDLADRGDEFVVTIDVPGYDTDDLDLGLLGDRLSISGERDREREVGEEREGANYIRRERETRSFDRRVRLPDPVDADEIEASVNNGVLTVRLPKLEGGEEARSIDIE